MDGRMDGSGFSTAQSTSVAHISASKVDIYRGIYIYRGSLLFSVKFLLFFSFEILGCLVCSKNINFFLTFREIYDQTFRK